MGFLLLRPFRPPDSLVVKAFPEEKSQGSLAGSGLEVPLPPERIALRQEVLAEEEVERSARGCARGVASEVNSQPLSQVGRVSDLKVFIRPAVEHVDAVPEFRRH